MQKKRSIGVTIFGWLFIISGIIGLLNILNPQNFIQVSGKIIFFFHIIISIASLICGIFILKLNQKARKAAILLCLIGLIAIPFYLHPIMKSTQSAMQSEEYYGQQKQDILERLKPEYQQKALEDLDRAREWQRKAVPFVSIFLWVILGIPVILLELLPIYFFTRPKVKEQFK